MGTPPGVPAWAKRVAVPDSETPVRSRTAIDRLIGRRDVGVREKTLWRMLYETCARAKELLAVNIEELDLAGRCAPVKSKGARARTRRGAGHGEFVWETVYWDAGTARLLPRLIKDRTRGPLFVAHRRPGPGKAVSDRDVCPDTGLARLSDGQARALLDTATASHGTGTGTGWDLHELPRPAPPSARRSSPPTCRRSRAGADAKHFPEAGERGEAGGRVVT